MLREHSDIEQRFYQIFNIQNKSGVAYFTGRIQPEITNDVLLKLICLGTQIEYFQIYPSYNYTELKHNVLLNLIYCKTPELEKKIQKLLEV